MFRFDLHSGNPKISQVGTSVVTLPLNLQNQKGKYWPVEEGENADVPLLHQFTGSVHKAIYKNAYQLQLNSSDCNHPELSIKQFTLGCHIIQLGKPLGLLLDVFTKLSMHHMDFAKIHDELKEAGDLHVRVQGITLKVEPNHNCSRKMKSLCLLSKVQLIQMHLLILLEMVFFDI